MCSVLGTTRLRNSVLLPTIMAGDSLRPPQGFQIMFWVASGSQKIQFTLFEFIINYHPFIHRRVTYTDDKL
jgi:hypothetical protein